MGNFCFEIAQDVRLWQWMKVVCLKASEIKWDYNGCAWVRDCVTIGVRVCLCLSLRLACACASKCVSGSVRVCVWGGVCVCVCVMREEKLTKSMEHFLIPHASSLAPKKISEELLGIAFCFFLCWLQNSLSLHTNKHTHTHTHTNTNTDKQAHAQTAI